MGKRFIVTFPDIGEGVVEGEIIEWLKKEGELLKQDEPVVVVMTDKATVELPAPKPGKLMKQHFQAGQMAIKDKPLYEIALENDSENIPEAEVPISNEPKPRKETSPSEISLKSNAHSSNQTNPSGVLAIPKVRHMAKLLDVDLSGIKGSGKDGRILLQDLHGNKSLQNPVEPISEALSLPDDECLPVIGIKKLMAKKMTESKARIPHFSYFETLDATRLIQLKKNVKKEAEGEGVHVTYMPFIIKALSKCIDTFRELNSSYIEEKSQLNLHRQHNIGIAMSTPLGLIVPVLKGVQHMSMSQLIHAYEELVRKALNSKLHSSDMKEGTITISNFGIDGRGLWATPVINYPEVAILAIAKVQQQPLVRNGVIEIREAMNLSWSFDHRVIDGNLAVQISSYLCKLLQNPASLL